MDDYNKYRIRDYNLIGVGDVVHTTIPRHKGSEISFEYPVIFTNAKGHIEGDYKCYDTLLFAAHDSATPGEDTIWRIPDKFMYIWEEIVSFPDRFEYIRKPHEEPWTEWEFDACEGSYIEYMRGFDESEYPQFNGKTYGQILEAILDRGDNV